MSLFGAMFSSVSGLDAQSQALAIISDNISNMNTTGFKATTSRFQTLVTTQASANAFSPGGVRIRPTQLIDQQGLLESSNSTTDLGISGAGFFIVNTNSDPALGNNLYTRAGSFNTDLNGLLQNTGGFYLQGWPTDANGDTTVSPNTANLQAVNTKIAQNSADPTTTISIGANLPASAANGTSFSNSALIYDSLGVDRTIDFEYTKVATNNWNIGTNAPVGSAEISFLDGSSTIASAGRIDFTALPTAADTISIEGVSYTFIAGATSGTNISIGTSLSQTITDLITAIADPRITKGTATADVNSILFKQSLPSVTTASVSETSATVTEVLGGTTQARTVVFDDVGGLASAGETFTVTVAGKTFTYTASVNDTDLIIATAIRDSINGSTSSSPLHATISGAGPVTLTVDVGDAMVYDTSGTSVTSQVNAGSTTISALALSSTIPAVTFNGNGTPNDFNFTTIAATWTNGANATSITMDLGTPGASGVAQADGLTQLSDNFSTIFVQQNGVPAGVLAGLSVGEDGTLTALFDNGQTRPIFQIPLATFQNPNALGALTGNVYQPTENSGNALLNTAGEGGAGKVAQNTLEASTVDIAEEFTKMIITQRAFSAASKTITTADEMLDELVRIKR